MDADPLLVRLAFAFVLFEPRVVSRNKGTVQRFNVKFMKLVQIGADPVSGPSRHPLNSA